MRKTTEDIGTRIAERMRVKGFWKDGRPDIGRFCITYGIIPSYMYRWLKGEMPRADRLIRLAGVLDVTARSGS